MFLVPEPTLQSRGAQGARSWGSAGEGLETLGL